MKFWGGLGIWLIMALCLSGSAAAQELSDQPDLTWDVTTPDPGVRHTGRVRALVRDLVEYEGHMYVGGKFLEVKAPDGSTFDQPYLARFDLESGAWDPSFRPVVDGMVYAIEISSDGRLYASGELSGGIAAYHASTGARINQFRPGIANSWGPPAVYDIELVGNDLYAGGTFTRSQGVSLMDLARVDARTGTIDPTWVPRTERDVGTPRLGGRNIFGLAVDAARGRVYLAGKFGAINGDTDAAYFATLDTETGDLRTDVPQGLPVGIPNHRESFSMWMMDVQWSGDRVYLGGQAHQTMTLRAEGLVPTHTFFTNRGVGNTASGGDTQVIFVGKDTVWSGCHCWGSVGEYPLFSYNAAPGGVQTYAEYRKWVVDFRDVNPFGQQPVGGGYGIDIASESLTDHYFDLRGQAGGYAINEDSNGRLWFGGQYTHDTANNRAVEGLVRYSPIDRQPAPTGLRSSLQTKERIVLVWDPLREASSFEILRDGVVVGTSDNRWHTDRGLEAGTEYRYTVRAVLADGAVGPASGEIVVSTDGGVVVAGPTGLRSTFQTRERVVLNWDPYLGARSFQILRDGAVVGTSDNRWHTDRELQAGAAYRYEVRAIAADGSASPSSAPVTVSTGP